MFRDWFAAVVAALNYPSSELGAAAPEIVAGQIDVSHPLPASDAVLSRLCLQKFTFIYTLAVDIRQTILNTPK